MVAHSDISNAQFVTSESTRRQTKTVLCTEARLGEEVLGWVKIEFDGTDAAYLEDIYVLPAYRHGGLADRLFRLAVAQAERRDVHVVFCDPIAYELNDDRSRRTVGKKEQLDLDRWYVKRGFLLDDQSTKGRASLQLP